MTPMNHEPTPDDHREEDDSAVANVQACPCGTCVSCSCAVRPSTDEDGLCASCGGTPVFIARLCEDGARAKPMHVASDVDDPAERDRIVVLIAEGAKSRPNQPATDDELAEVGFGEDPDCVLVSLQWLQRVAVLAPKMALELKEKREMAALALDLCNDFRDAGEASGAKIAALYGMVKP